MRKSVARLRGIGFILWHTRHEFYHVLVGLVWSWFLRELWHEFNGIWVAIAAVGSLVPDVDHFVYFATYGRRDWYTRQIRAFLRHHQWRSLWVFVEHGHKQYQTSLATHNYYFMTLLFVLTVGSFLYAWNIGVIFFGALILHYVFDLLDDVVTLGYINVNWKRLWRP